MEYAETHGYKKQANVAKECIRSFIPILGLCYAPSTPTYDDLEKILNILGFIDGLTLAYVGGVVFENQMILDAEDDDPDSGIVNPNAEAIYEALYVSFCLYSLVMFMVVITYMYLQIYCTQKTDVDVGDDDDEKEKAEKKENVQIVRWWAFGRHIIGVIVIFFLVASLFFTRSVNLFYESKVEHRVNTTGVLYGQYNSTSFDYGALKSEYTSYALLVIGVLIIHVSYTWNGSLNAEIQAREDQKEEARNALKKAARLEAEHAYNPIPID